jgi:serine protease AprX
MAGIIAGHDAGTRVGGPITSTSPFDGMAPDSRIVSVKVADAYGASDVSQVIAGIDWVVQHKNDAGLHVRVLNLSFGTTSTQPYVLDPLAHAAEQAWLHGIVVVVSAGNDGTGTGRLLDPAVDPYVIAVGADTSNGTPAVGDDTIPDFSSRGDGVRNPDVVAPGTSVQSLRVPGSYIDTQYASTGKINDRFFRGSGTSQAAAVVSGAAALLLQKNPSLTPDQVKALLGGTAVRLPSADPQAQGKGLIKVDSAASVPSPSNSALVWTRSSGTGSLDAARGGARLAVDGVELAGEQDIFGAPYDSAAMAPAEAGGNAWTGGSWNGNVWTGRTWMLGSWTSGVWTPSWDSATWSGFCWSGRPWAGRIWATGNWTGRTWASQSWADPTSTADGSLTGRTWAGRTWADGGWTTAGWH